LERFLARQPIFDSRRAVYGYELLYRSGPENRFTGSEFDAAAASTLDGLLLFGIERLVPGCRAFMNCTRDFLLRDFALMLPRDRVVIEILETVQIDDELIESCRRLKHTGYLLALDDFQDDDAWKPWSISPTSLKWICWQPLTTNSSAWPALSCRARFVESPKK
jgi:c-di-GMP-related signal transduction protein